MSNPERQAEKVVIGPNFLSHWFIYDFEICMEYDELKKTMNYINHHGYDLISVTQGPSGEFTVFFRRRACG